MSKIIFDRLPETIDELKALTEQPGFSMTDPNVTAERIADEYEIFYRSVKVMPPGYSNVIEEVTSKAEES